MKLQLDVIFAVLVFTVVMTTSKRSPRRNRNQVELQDAAEDTAVEEAVGGDDVCELEVTCKGGRSLPVSLPIKAPRGPAGKPGTPGLPGKQGPPGTPVCPDRVAFFVGLSLNVGPVSDNSDLPFDKVITNVGNAFNPETGRFTAPFNGTFLFSLTIAAQGRQRVNHFVCLNKYAAVELVLNRKMIATIWAESIPYWASASNTAILNMEAGDQVWLVLLSRAPYLHGYMYTTFSGHCLYRGV
ncbi:unnamed protein product [Candidula unifasciata]|uniref:C1q domain-containing protein n=1 Tax=Candidula unifasciata TaxID=100452 RepID=A0A8S3YIW1_9EUPU|nr:unnamed protein product [Candidula unifasciata]